MDNQKQEVVQGVREVFGNLPAAVAPKDPAAVALGLKSYGKPKTLTDEERARRSEHIKRVTAARVAKRAASAGTSAPSPAGPVVPAPSTAPAAPSPSTSPAANRVQAKSSVRYVSRGVVAPSSRAYPERRVR